MTRRSSLAISTAGGTGSEVAGNKGPVIAQILRSTRRTSKLLSSSVRITEEIGLQTPASGKNSSLKLLSEIAATRAPSSPVEEGGDDTDDELRSTTPKGSAAPGSSHRSGYTDQDNKILLERLAKVQETAKEAAGSQGRFISISDHLSELVKQYPEYRSTGKDPNGAVRARIFNSDYSLKAKFVKEYKLRNRPHSGDGSYAEEFAQSDDLYEAGLALWSRDKHVTCNEDDILSLGGGGTLKKKKLSKSPRKKKITSAELTPAAGGKGGKVGNKGSESGSKKKPASVDLSVSDKVRLFV